MDIEGGTQAGFDQQGLHHLLAVRADRTGQGVGRHERLQGLDRGARRRVHCRRERRGDGHRGGCAGGEQEAQGCQLGDGGDFGRRTPRPDRHGAVGLVGRIRHELTEFLCCRRHCGLC